MFYQKIKPPIHLQPFIECYFSWEGKVDRPIKIDSPPSGFCSLVFNYCEPYWVSNFKAATPQMAPLSFITGQSTQHYELLMRGKIGMIGVVFRPAGVGTLLNLPLAELTDVRIDLSLVLPSQEIRELEDKIQNEASHPGKIDHLTHYLNAKYLTNAMRYDSIDWAANHIVDSNGIIVVDDLMNQLFLSRRQFERKFLSKVGLSPKYYARIRRISYICHLMAGKRQTNWPRLLHSCGYYDQAHFIKDFKTFLGRTPSDYLLHNSELAHYLKQC